ncbi:gas vesicle accessory protein GvpU [Piscibacillus sp. B03]|uniref:gas vesicle accessory protein GvpU n=1 Tax=Piscibacillus sp. B03 TaxID=3457430 RepID=UPI003FCC9590
MSASQYFQEMSEKFQEGNDVAKLFSEKLSKTSEYAAQQNSEDIQYIHLKDAQVYNGDQKPTPSKTKFLWRGKLSEVDGFFLGTINNEQKG